MSVLIKVVLFDMELGVGDMAKIYHNFYFIFHENHNSGLITILFHVGFTILQVTEYYSQTNVPILKTKPYKVTTYTIKKNGRHLGQSQEDKNLCHYFLY